MITSKSCLSTVLALALLAGAAAPALADPIDDAVARRMKRSHIPGVAVAVVEKGRVTKLKAYGQAELDWNMPAAPDTAFQLASATKLFTGIALMRLVEQGRLTLDDPLTRFFDDAPESWSKIKVRQLATHTSGLPDNLPTPRPATVSDILSAAKKAPLAYEPGTEARYGFTDFVVLRALMEKASGKTIETLFTDEIIKPLGLKRTGFTHTRDEGQIRSSDVFPHRASIYAWTKGLQRRSDFLYGETGYGAGGLYASAADLAAVFAALDQGRLLKPESFDILQTPPLLPNGAKAGYGVGWTVGAYRGQAVVGHSGGPALADVMRVKDRKLTIIALTNQQRFYPLLAQDVADALLPPAPKRPDAKDDAPDLTKAVMAVLADAHGGKIDPARFSETGKKAVPPFLNGFGQALLEAVGAPKAVRLLAEKTQDGLRSRRYEVRFEEKTMPWLVQTDAAGAIESIRPCGEDEL